MKFNTPLTKHRTESDVEPIPFQAGFSCLDAHIKHPKLGSKLENDGDPAYKEQTRHLKPAVIMWSRPLSGFKVRMLGLRNAHNFVKQGQLKPRHALR